ncbi:MAG: hypothetical protein ACRC1D_08080 [Culicoidibacterales bacterium]
MAKINKIILIRGSPYHPQTTGSIERLNRTLLGKLKKITGFGKYEWDIMLKKATFSYNILISRPLGISPYEFKYKKLPLLEIDRSIMGKIVENGIPADGVRKVHRNIRKYKSSYGVEKIRNKFKVGDRVLYYDPVGSIDKLGSRWKHGGKIIKADFRSYLFVSDDGKIRRANEQYVKIFGESSVGTRQLQLNAASCRVLRYGSISGVVRLVVALALLMSRVVV